MKKTLITIIAAAAMIMGLASCDMLAKDALKNDGKSWANDTSKASLTSKDPDYTISGRVILMPKDGFDVENKQNGWFLWTDENGIVLDKQPVAKLDDDKNVCFDFKGLFNEASKVVVLYTRLEGTNKSQKNPETGKKEAFDLTKYDVRGRFAVFQERVTRVKLEKYPEVIAPVGVVTITNDEPVSTSVYTNGDYTITEIWPLDPKADKDGNTAENDKVGGSYVVSDTMVFKKLEVKKGNTIKVPVKAGKQIIGLYQPKRDEKTSGTELVYGGPSAADIVAEKRYDLDGDGEKEATRADLYEFAKKVKEDNLDPTNEKQAKKIEKLFADANIETVFANEIKVTAHGTVNAGNSSDFGTYFFNHKKMIRMREAGDEVYDVEVIEGKMEK